MRRIFTTLLGILCLNSISYATIVTTGPSPVMSHTMNAYEVVTNGDVVFRLTGNTLQQCYGFWLRASDPGFKTNFAILLSTVQTQGALAVSADDTQIWTGSSNNYCLVYNLNL